MSDRHIRNVNPNVGCPLCSNVIPAAFIAEIIAAAKELSEPMSAIDFINMLVHAPNTQD